MMNKLIELENVSFKVAGGVSGNNSGGEKFILRDVSFGLERGGITGLAGESGCGKSTLAKILSGLLVPSAGTVKRNFNGTAGGVQLLFQNTDELINPLRKVKSILGDLNRSADEIKAELEKTGIRESLLDSYGYQLSGGERQRVGLCRLLLAKPELLILDEPFSAQDAESKQKFLALLNELNKNSGVTILCITHEIGLLRNLAEKIMIMFGGGIVESGSESGIFETPFHPYTKFLIDSSRYKLERKDFIFGEQEIKSGGCLYYERCDRRGETCLSGVNHSPVTDHQYLCNFPLH